MHAQVDVKDANNLLKSNSTRAVHSTCLSRIMYLSEIMYLSRIMCPSLRAGELLQSPKATPLS